MTERCQSRPLQLMPTAVCVGRRDLPAVHLHAASLTPVTSRHCSPHTQGGGWGTVPSWKSMLTARSLQLLVVLDQALPVYIWWPVSLHSLADSPSICTTAQPWSNPHHRLPLPRAVGEAQQPQECTPVPGPLQLPISPQLALALAPCSGPHHCMCLQLAPPTTLVPAVKCKHITALATTTASLGPGGASEDPPQPLQPLQPEPKRHHTPLDSVPSHALGDPAPLNPRSQHAPAVSTCR